MQEMFRGNGGEMNENEEGEISDEVRPVLLRFRNKILDCTVSNTKINCKLTICEIMGLRGVYYVVKEHSFSLTAEINGKSNGGNAEHVKYMF